MNKVDEDDHQCRLKHHRTGPQAVLRAAHLGPCRFGGAAPQRIRKGVHQLPQTYTAKHTLQGLLTGRRMHSDLANMPSFVTSPHVRYYCTYYIVSLTCTVHCTYCIYCTLYILYMFPSFPVSHVCQMLKLHLQHLFTHAHASFSFTFTCAHSHSLT